MALSASHRQPPITVAVIDKNPLVVRGLDQMLREDGRFELVLSAPNGDEFLADYAARGVAAQRAGSSTDAPESGAAAHPAHHSASAVISTCARLIGGRRRGSR